MAVLCMDFSLKTVSLREMKTPRKLGDALKPKFKKRTKITRFHKVSHPFNVFFLHIFTRRKIYVKFILVLKLKGGNEN